MAMGHRTTCILSRPNAILSTPHTRDTRAGSSRLSSRKKSRRVNFRPSPGFSLPKRMTVHFVINERMCPRFAGRLDHWIDVWYSPVQPRARCATAAGSARARVYKFRRAGITKDDEGPSSRILRACSLSRNNRGRVFTASNKSPRARALYNFEINARYETRNGDGKGRNARRDSHCAPMTVRDRAAPRDPSVSAAHVAGAV